MRSEALLLKLEGRVSSRWSVCMWLLITGASDFDALMQEFSMSRFHRCGSFSQSLAALLSGIKCASHSVSGCALPR